LLNCAETQKANIVLDNFLNGERIMAHNIFRHAFMIAASLVSLSCCITQGARAQQQQFDAGLFQNSEFISAIFNQDGAAKTKPKAFVWYAYGLGKVLNQDRLCRSIIKGTTLIAINQAYLKTDPVRETAAAQCLRGTCKPTKGLDNIQLVIDQGNRDGDGVVVRVSCQSETGLKLIRNLDAIFGSQ
jgi:hypothetical protein